MMFLKGAFMFLLAAMSARANGMDVNLQTFVQDAVPEGGIIFSGAVQTDGITYDLFILEQRQRRGVMVIANRSTNQPSVPLPKVLFADTSFDIAVDRDLIPSEVCSQLCALLGTSRSTLEQPQTVAAAQDIYPLGAVLNTVLNPIAGFTFRSNSTLGILRELEQSDAIPINPSAAPVGSVLVCPTTCSPTGPVSLGSVTIVGSDGNVYGPDIRRGCAWTSFGKLETWIRLHANKNQLFGFLLRAHPERT
jgi:hypothetical protein